MKNLLILLSLFLVSSVSAADSTMEIWSLWNDSMVWTQDAWVNQDGSVMTNGSSIQENNVMAWDTQVTDKQVIAWDQVVNMWAETSLTPLSEDNVEFNSAWLSWWANNWVTMWNVEVDVLPTTWLEESLLILVSIFLSGLIIFRNKFIKK